MPILPAGLLSVVAAVATTAVATAAVAEPPTVSLTLKGHRFTPQAINVPAGQKIRIVLINQDPATEEFDSHDLKIEQLVTPNGRATFTVGPLKPGAYAFMGEFHPQTAQGRVTAIDQGR